LAGRSPGSGPAMEWEGQKGCEISQTRSSRLHVKGCAEHPKANLCMDASPP
jgi:hypothetical protein